MPVLSEVVVLVAGALAFAVLLERRRAVQAQVRVTAQGALVGRDVAVRIGGEGVCGLREEKGGPAPVLLAASSSGLGECGEVIHGCSEIPGRATKQY